ncbi:hypothetical protein YQE_02604, partial [Dendroctonus ponderosae]
MSFQERFSINIFCLIKDIQIKFHLYEESLNSSKHLEILRTVLSEFLENPYMLFLTGWSTGSLRWVPWDWSARSPDLTPPDFFFWGKLKENVHNTPVNNIGKLRRRIIHCIGELDVDEIQRATNHSVSVRILKCLESKGRHVENVL